MDLLESFNTPSYPSTMAKKSANNPKASKNASTAATASSGSTPRTAAVPAPGYMSSQEALAQMRQGPHPVLLFFLLTFPLLMMYWSSESPARPFSLVVAKESGELLPSSDWYFVKPNVLLVTAHPDDEVLFAPTILSLLKEGTKGNVSLWAICLSTGDYGGGKEMGTKRIGEWHSSWNTLGLEENRRLILDVPYVIHFHFEV